MVYLWVIKRRPNDRNMSTQHIATLPNIYEIIHICTAVVDESECDHRSKFSNLSNWKEEAWKKIRASTGFEPKTSAIPVRRTTCCVRSATVLRHVGCCWLRFENGQIWANNTQHVATCCNRVAKRTQHVAPNNVAICCVGMLRSFGRRFTLQMW